MTMGYFILDENHDVIKVNSLFETMIFANGNYGNDEYQNRCCTWKQALEMHVEAIEWLKKYLLSEEKYEFLEEIDSLLEKRKREILA